MTHNFKIVLHRAPIFGFYFLKKVIQKFITVCCFKFHLKKNIYAIFAYDQTTVSKSMT